ncbi:hypothetical protein Taro_028064 [Colocasia esculenta]|uniref:TRASH domain-containing protein n=1 Tax=Colocasia esculenta TaxID=4460 RepID=A0A843VJX8_COLES|nr:hypothetical protein [Colocasia esculenta]
MPAFRVGLLRRLLRRRLPARGEVIEADTGLRFHHGSQVSNSKHIVPVLSAPSFLRKYLNFSRELLTEVTYMVYICFWLTRTELCRFSGAKIYPGKGIRFVRADSQVFLFANSKCKRYFHNRLRPAKLTWTAMYRKQHKKDIHAEAVKKRRRTTKKPYSRSIVGATLEVIQKKRAEKAEVRDAAREAALREIKERIKKTKDEKKAKKAEIVAKTQKTQTKGGMPRAPKGPKLGGGGGKR